MIPVPQDVIDYLKAHFANCNREVSKDLTNYPGAYEEHLDMNLISYWAKRQAPHKLPSNWVVKVDVNFMGGGHHMGAYEVADIGIIIIFRNHGKVVRSKMAFLQSKKLYASPLKKKATRNELYGYGMGGLLLKEEDHNDGIKQVKYSFAESSRYEALSKNDEQQQAMRAFQNRYQMKMYYLFYNPCTIPLEVMSPFEEELNLTVNEIGCRIMPKNSIDTAMDIYPNKYSPTYGDIKYLLPIEFDGIHQAGWRLEYFIVDLMVGCKEGVIDDSPHFESLQYFMNQKRRPMASSIAITFDIVD